MNVKQFSQMLVFLTLIICTFASAQKPPATASSINKETPPAEKMADWPSLITELTAMYQSDQQTRTDLTALQVKARADGKQVDHTAMAALLNKMKETDKQNQNRFATIISDAGWPKRSVVGSISAAAAWLVVQHAPLDYQLKMAPLIRETAAQGEVLKSDLALLEDRMLLRQNKPQRYGSQVDTKNGVNLFPIEDEATLDVRRAEVGLGPICKYLENFTAAHGKITYKPCVK